jgi:mannan endo-1,4-beta-mannosidase
MRPLSILATAVAIVCAVGGAAVEGARYHADGTTAVQKALASDTTVRASVGLSSEPGIGAYTADNPASMAGLSAFTAETGITPKWDLYFSGWGEPFQTSFADDVAREGGVPLVQIEPYNVTMQQISGGSKDEYLIDYAQEVKAYKLPVVLSFGHEMNGNWYPWGWQHVTPAQFIAAYQHVVDVFRAQGADNVTWMWTVNDYADAATLTSPIADWWPGSDYVDWVGIDGHIITSGETFSDVFGPAIADVRKLTSKPIMIAETAIGPNAGQAAKMGNLFAGVKDDNLIGLVWFNAPKNEAWQLGSPAAITAFAEAVKQYGYIQGK